MIELIVVMVIILILSSLSFVNLLSGTRRLTRTSTREQLVSDLKAMQIKAMSGTNPGTGFGVQINAHSYTLLPENFEIKLDNIDLETTFAQTQIIFLPLSGEISGFINGQNSITLIDATDGTVQVIYLNSYGVVL